MESYRCSLKTEEKEIHAIIVADNMYQVVNMFGLIFYLKEDELNLVSAARIDTNFAAVYPMYINKKGEGE